MAGRESFACCAEETIFHPKDDGKPMKEFELGGAFFYD